MLDERILTTIEKVGQEIKSANELDIELINTLAEKIPEWQEYKNEIENSELLYCEEVREEIMGNYGISITLKDKSTWNIVTTWSTEQKCIKHKLFPKGIEDNEIYIFESLDDDLYLCDECKTFGKKHPEILNKYSSCEENSNNWIFPRDWTEEGIESWCKKREIQQEEYEDRRIERELERIDEGFERQERRMLFADCYNCSHMKHNECEYGNNYDFDEEYCEDWEER